MSTKFGFVVLLLFFLFFVSTTIFSLITASTTSKSRVFFQYFHINNLPHEISNQEATNHQRIKQNEEYKFRNEYGDHFLTTNFGSQEFRCTGSCFCEDSENSERRITSTIAIRKGITAFVVAMSSIIAYKKANEVFHEECKVLISNEQPKCEAKIKSTVDKCKEVYPENYDFATKETEDRDNIRRYYCSGHCLPNGNLKNAPSKRKAIEFDCESLKQHGVVVFKGPNLQHKNTKARNTFRKLYLTEFCRVNSIREVVWSSKLYNKTYKKYYNQVRKSKVPLCSGVSKITKFRKGRKPGQHNPSVRCERTFPLFKNPQVDDDDEKEEEEEE